MKGKREQNPRKALVIAIIVFIVFFGALAGLLIYAASRHSYRPIAATPTPSPSPSPGRPGNPGDESKSAQGQTTAPAPASSSTPAPVQNNISFFAVAPQTNGQVRVQSQLSGVSAGTCTLTLVSPAGRTQSSTGQVTWSGSYYFCSFGTISGVTEKGSWKGTLQIIGGGKTSSQSTTFEVN